MRNVLVSLMALVIPLAFGLSQAQAQEGTKADKERAKIDKMAQDTLDRLFQESPETKTLYNNAYGYAVFQNVKVALGVSGGGGHGVAVDKSDKEHYYMKMGTAGVGLGLGGQKYQVVFFFEDEPIFDNFVFKGWQAGAEAEAAAGEKGAAEKVAFKNGIAVFQLTKKGLMANADISGTKYWIDKDLTTAEIKEMPETPSKEKKEGEKSKP